MSIEPTTPKQYHYLVVEDVEDVVARLVHQMQHYAHWQCAGTTGIVRQAIKLIDAAEPHLIFCDWDLIGGSGFEVLKHIRSKTGYHPYIVFNTGFQTDHPEIAEELINTYKVDAFINKPYWKKLMEQLPTILEKAHQKVLQQAQVNNDVWLRTAQGEKIKIDPLHITAVLQHPNVPRYKCVYLNGQAEPIIAVLTWPAVTTLLQDHAHDHFAINRRYAIICRAYLQRYQSHHVWVGNPPLRLEVVRENAKAFEEWVGSAASLRRLKS